MFFSGEHLLTPDIGLRTKNYEPSTKHHEPSTKHHALRTQN